MWIGDFTTLASLPANMKVGDVAIWSRKLGASGIRTLADRSNPMLGGALYDPTRTVVSFAGIAAPPTGNWSWLNHLSNSPYGVSQ